jgi:hypothetical protein
MFGDTEIAKFNMDRRHSESAKLPMAITGDYGCTIAPGLHKKSIISGDEESGRILQN